MANQSPDRRQILTLLSNVAALSQFSVFHNWAFAADHFHHPSAAPLSSDAYAPQFFTPDEYRTLDVVCELIIPADETPGARQAGVPEFIDFMVSQDGDLQYPFRTGLARLNAFAVQRYGAAFLELAPARQNALLEILGNPASTLSTGTEDREFFLLARKYTVIGYYTSRVGLEELDYPGLRLYAESPECPHKDDPEHKHLSASRAQHA